MSTWVVFFNAMLLVGPLTGINTTAQVVLCDIAGCTNGICLKPPEVAQFTCNCSTGFRPYTDTNVCEDVDECALDPYRCGYSYARPYDDYDRYHYPRAHTYLWSFRSSGKCVNTLGSFYCMCYPPRIQAPGGSACLDPPAIRTTRRDRVFDLAILSGIIDN